MKPLSSRDESILENGFINLDSVRWRFRALDACSEPFPRENCGSQPAIYHRSAGNLQCLYLLSDSGAALFQDWEISTLQFEGFDFSIGMFYSGGSVDAFDNVVIQNNFIEAILMLAAASPAVRGWLTRGLRLLRPRTSDSPRRGDSVPIRVDRTRMEIVPA